MRISYDRMNDRLAYMADPNRRWDVFAVMDKPRRDPDWRYHRSFHTLPEAVDYARGYIDEKRNTPDE